MVRLKVTVFKVSPPLLTVDLHAVHVFRIEVDIIIHEVLKFTALLLLWHFKSASSAGRTSWTVAAFRSAVVRRQLELLNVLNFVA